MNKLQTFIFAVLAGAPAGAHDAKPTAAQPSGWTYPLSCCSGFDCREIRDQAVVEGPRGYLIKLTGEVIMPRDTRIKNSPDGQFHQCHGGRRGYGSHYLPLRSSAFFLRMWS